MSKCICVTSSESVPVVALHLERKFECITQVSLGLGSLALTARTQCSEL